MKFVALTLHVAMAVRQLGSGLGRRPSGKLELFSRCLFGRHPTTLPFDLSLSRWPSLLHRQPRGGRDENQDFMNAFVAGDAVLAVVAGAQLRRSDPEGVHRGTMRAAIVVGLLSTLAAPPVLPVPPVLPPTSAPPPGGSAPHPNPGAEVQTITTRATRTPGRFMGAQDRPWLADKSSPAFQRPVPVTNRTHASIHTAPPR